MAHTHEAAKGYLVYSLGIVEEEVPSENAVESM